jgi:hypothetical protein
LQQRKEVRRLLHDDAIKACLEVPVEIVAHVHRGPIGDDAAGERPGAVDQRPRLPVGALRNPVRSSQEESALPDGFTANDYFDDFDDSTDQPKLLRTTDFTGTFSGLAVKVYSNKKWVFYDVSNQFSDFFVDRGQLVMIHGDTAQGTMTSQAMYPKRAVQLPTADNAYVHVTYEVQKDETPRRYEMLTLCGSDKAGDTYDGGAPKAAPLPRPGFMHNTPFGDMRSYDNVGFRENVQLPTNFDSSVCFDN